MRTPRIVIPKPADPFAPEIASRLALKRLRAQRAERSRTAPVVKDEPVAYVSPGILTSLASTIRGYIGRAM